MPGKPTPNWQPLSALPLVAHIIDGSLSSNEEQYQTLLQAKDRPYILDDALVARVIRLYTEQQDDHWVMEEQLARWKKLNLSEAQRQEIERLEGQLARDKELIEAVLELADELKEGTIEKMLGKDDAELGLEELLRQLGL